MTKKGEILKDIEFLIYELISYLKARDELNHLHKGDTKKLAKILYQLYVNDPSFKEHVLDIPNLEINEKSREHISALFEKYKKSLVKALALCMEAQRQGEMRIFGYTYSEWQGRHWIENELFDPSGSYKKRIYVNCKPGSLHNVIELFLKEYNWNFTCPACNEKYKDFESYCTNCYLKHDKRQTRRNGLVIFKFINPRKIDLIRVLRLDKIVFYFKDDPNNTFNDVIKVLLKCGKWLEDVVPKGTIKLAPGISWIRDTTWSHRDIVQPIFGFGSGSFGQFMAVTISLELCAWVKKNKKVPNKRGIKQIAGKIFKDELVAELYKDGLID